MSGNYLSKNFPFNKTKLPCKPQQNNTNYEEKNQNSQASNAKVDQITIPHKNKINKKCSLRNTQINVFFCVSKTGEFDVPARRRDVFIRGCGHSQLLKTTWRYKFKWFRVGGGSRRSSCAGCYVSFSLVMGVFCFCVWLRFCVVFLGCGFCLYCRFCVWFDFRVLHFCVWLIFVCCIFVWLIFLCSNFASCFLRCIFLYPNFLYSNFYIVFFSAQIFVLHFSPPKFLCRIFLYPIFCAAFFFAQIFSLF